MYVDMFPGLFHSKPHSNSWKHLIWTVFFNAVRTIHCYIMVLCMYHCPHIAIKKCSVVGMSYIGFMIFSSIWRRDGFCTCHDCHLKNLCNYIGYCVHIKCPGNLFSQPLLHFLSYQVNGVFVIVGLHNGSRYEIHTTVIFSIYRHDVKWVIMVYMCMLHNVVRVL